MPTSSIKRPTNLAGSLSLLGSFAAAFFGLDWLVARGQFWSCPSGTFLAGGAHHFLQVIALFFCSSALALLAIDSAGKSALIYRWLGGEQFFGTPIERRKINRVAGVVFLISTILGFALSTVNFCLTSSDIVLRSGVWGTAHRYSWQDVDMIKTGCHHSKSSWGTDFQLYLRNGEEIDVPQTDLADAYPHLKNALRNGTFTFDASGVDPECGADERVLLLTRP